MLSTSLTTTSLPVKLQKMNFGILSQAIWDFSSLYKISLIVIDGNTDWEFTAQDFPRT